MHCGVEVTESSTNKQHHLSIKKRSAPFRRATLDRTSVAATRRVCLEGALARPCTFSVVMSTAPRLVGISRAFFLFLLHKHFINKK
jgi:hypothetical protein